MKVSIDRDTLYDREELETLLSPLGIDADYFISRLRPRKVFKRAFLGSDILEAYRTAAPFTEGKMKRIPARSKSVKRKDARAIARERDHKPAEDRVSGSDFARSEIR